MTTSISVGRHSYSVGDIHSILGMGREKPGELQGRWYHQFGDCLVRIFHLDKLGVTTRSGLGQRVFAVRAGDIPHAEAAEANFHALSKVAGWTAKDLFKIARDMRKQPGNTVVAIEKQIVIQLGKRDPDPKMDREYLKVRVQYLKRLDDKAFQTELALVEALDIVKSNRVNREWLSRKVSRAVSHEVTGIDHAELKNQAKQFKKMPAQSPGRPAGWFRTLQGWFPSLSKRT